MTYGTVLIIDTGHTSLLGVREAVAVTQLSNYELLYVTIDEGMVHSNSYVPRVQFASNTSRK